MSAERVIGEEAAALERICDRLGAGTLANARRRLPPSLWARLFARLSEQAQAVSAPVDRWRGHRVVLLDGTCVSMPDENALFEALGQCSTRHGPSRYPVARLVTAALANTMTVLGHALGGYTVDETHLSFALPGILHKGDLLVADRHFAGANLYHRYLSAGLEFLTRSSNMQSRNMSASGRRSSLPHSANRSIRSVNLSLTFVGKSSSREGGASPAPTFRRQCFQTGRRVVTQAVS